LVITSTPTGRFVYWPDRKPADLTNKNSRCITYLETLPFQEGTPLSPTEEEHIPTEVVTIGSRLCTPDPEVFMVVREARTSENRVDQYLDDILADEKSANTPQTRLLRLRMPGASTTEDELINAGGFEKLSLSRTSQRPSIKLKTEYTPPLSNASCLSLR
jgi:hypothetical protein